MTLQDKMVFVRCKSNGCRALIPAPDYAQVPPEHLHEVLHERNYYLCLNCGNVEVYSKDEHFYDEPLPAPPAAEEP